jgi:hypothetical protein
MGDIKLGALYMEVGECKVWFVSQLLSDPIATFIINTTNGTINGSFINITGPINITVSDKTNVLKSIKDNKFKMIYNCIRILFGNTEFIHLLYTAKKGPRIKKGASVYCHIQKKQQSEWSINLYKADGFANLLYTNCLSQITSSNWLGQAQLNQDALTLGDFNNNGNININFKQNVTTQFFKEFLIYLDDIELNENSKWLQLISQKLITKSPTNTKLQEAMFRQQHINYKAKQQRFEQQQLEQQKLEQQRLEQQQLEQQKLEQQRLEQQQHKDLNTTTGRAPAPAQAQAQAQAADVKKLYKKATAAQSRAPAPAQAQAQARAAKATEIKKQSLVNRAKLYIKSKSKPTQRRQKSLARGKEIAAKELNNNIARRARATKAQVSQTHRKPRKATGNVDNNH